MPLCECVCLFVCSGCVMCVCVCSLYICVTVSTSLNVRMSLLYTHAIT